MIRFGCAFLLMLLPAAAWSQAPAPITSEPLLPPTQLYPRVTQPSGASQPGGSGQPAPQVVQPSVPAPAAPQVVQPSLSGLPAPAVQQPPQPGSPAQPGYAIQPPAGSPTPPAVQGPPGISAQPLPSPQGAGGQQGGTPVQPGTAQPTGTPNAETAPPPPNPWLPQGAAVLQVLDKPNAQSGTMTVKVGQSGTYGSLTITVQACLVRPPDMPQDAAAYLVIADSHTDQPGFKGWMLHSDPSLDMLQNPIYDVRVLGCAP